MLKYVISDSARKQALKKGKALWDSNDKVTAGLFFQKALKVTWNMVKTTIEVYELYKVFYYIKFGVL